MAKRAYLKLILESIFERLPNWATLCIAYFLWYFGLMRTTHNNLDVPEKHSNVVYDTWSRAFMFLPVRTAKGNFLWLTWGWINVMEIPTGKRKKVTYNLYNRDHMYVVEEHVFKVLLVSMSEKDHTTMLLKQKLSAAI